MATIVQRQLASGSVSWQARIRIKGFPLHSRTFADLQSAAQWARRREGHLRARIQRFKDDNDLRRIARSKSLEQSTLGDLLVRYRDTITPTKRGAEQEVWRIGGMLKQSICLHLAVRLSAMHVAEWRDGRLREVSGSTVNRELNLFGHVIEIASKEWGLQIPVNPFRGIRRPPSNPSRERRLKDGEEARLLDAARLSRSGYLEDVIVIAIETAMRQGEVIGLEWDRVDLDACSIRLDKTKNGRTRGVALSRRAIAVLRRLHADQCAQRTRQQIARVFPGVSSQAVKQAFRRAARRANLENFRFHDLRHEAISRMFERGLTPMEVAQISGHQTLQLLQRYTHLQLSELAKKLG
jgi:integrase